MAEPDVTAGAGRVLPGSLRGEQVLDLGVEGLDGGINLVVLGSQSRLISSVLIISRNIISATRGAGRSGQTGRSRGTLIQIREWIDMLLTVGTFAEDPLMYNGGKLSGLQNDKIFMVDEDKIDVLTAGPTYPGGPRAPGEPMVPWLPALPSLPAGPWGPEGP